MGCPQGICQTLFSSSAVSETWKMYSTWQPSSSHKSQSSSYQRTFQGDNYIIQYMTFTTRIMLGSLCWGFPSCWHFPPLLNIYLGQKTVRPYVNHLFSTMLAKGRVLTLQRQWHTFIFLPCYLINWNNGNVQVSPLWFVSNANGLRFADKENSSNGLHWQLL